MYIQLIQKYYAEIDKIKRYGGASNESSLQKAFHDLLPRVYGQHRNDEDRERNAVMSLRAFFAKQSPAPNVVIASTFGLAMT